MILPQRQNKIMIRLKNIMIASHPWTTWKSMESIECMASMGSIDICGFHEIHEIPWNCMESMESMAFMESVDSMESIESVKCMACMESHGVHARMHGINIGKQQCNHYSASASFRSSACIHISSSGEWAHSRQGVNTRGSLNKKWDDWIKHSGPLILIQSFGNGLSQHRQDLNKKEAVPKGLNEKQRNFIFFIQAVSQRPGWEIRD